MNELTKAREMVENRKKEEFIKSFENGSRQKTDLLRENEHGHATFYYGVAALDNGKLIGFDMMKYYKMYDENGRGHASPVEPYTDEKGKQIRLNVDEYLKFQENLMAEDTRPFVRIAKQNEEDEIRKKKRELRRERLSSLLGIFKKGRSM